MIEENLVMVTGGGVLAPDVHFSIQFPGYRGMTSNRRWSSDYTRENKDDGEG